MMPESAKAAVIINEIAWMGDAVSANHEWLELYNNGSGDVSLEGWMIKDGLNLEIPLSGNIGALDYAVLERTSEESALGPALLIYTGAMVNTGATLTLYNSSGEIADQVAGGENWVGVGGDNTTKETAQYTGSGWVTDEATPGKVNKTGRVEEEDEVSPAPETNQTNDSSSTPKPKTSSNKNETVRLVTLNTELKLKLDFQTLAYVNQPVNFSVVGSGIGENIINSLNYVWNFGDTNTGSGKKATHAYAYPGTYVVTLRANYARHNEVVRQEITVLPVTLSITKNDAGDVQINNDAPYDVELSGFVVRGVNDFIFPPDTIIIPRGTITIKASKLGIINKSQSVFLFDQEKVIVASTYVFPFLASITNNMPAVAEIKSYPREEMVKTTFLNTGNPKPVLTNFNFARSTEVTPLVGTTTVGAEVASGEPDTILSIPKALATDDTDKLLKTDEVPSTENKWAYLALIGLLFLGFIGLLLRSNNPPPRES